MGNTYVDNTIQLLEAITENCDKKHTPISDKTCHKCSCVPNYLYGQYCDITSPTHKPKPRKLIRKHTNLTKYTPQTSMKSHFLPIPAPIMIEESYCSDASSLDLGIATIELPNDNPSIHSNNSSYSTVDINASVDYEHEHENVSEHSVENDYKLQVQNDIIQRNVLHICKEYYDDTNNESDQYTSSASDYSDREKSNVDNFFDGNNAPYHEEGVESETELVMNLGIELRKKSNVYLQKRRKKHRMKRKRKKHNNKKVNPMY